MYVHVYLNNWGLELLRVESPLIAMNFTSALCAILEA